MPLLVEVQLALHVVAQLTHDDLDLLRHVGLLDVLRHLRLEVLLHALALDTLEVASNGTLLVGVTAPPWEPGSGHAPAHVGLRGRMRGHPPRRPGRRIQEGRERARRRASRPPFPDRGRKCDADTTSNRPKLEVC